jgi:ketosteroid isomerase-like protein
LKHARWMALVGLAIFPGLTALGKGQSKPGRALMNPTNEQAKIMTIIDSYAKALENADAALWESLYWLDDVNFSEIENDKPHVLDRRYIEQIGAALRKRGSSQPNQRWYDTKVYLLSPDVAYSVSLREEINTATTSRVTLIYQKKRGEWRIIHGHFSDVPK